MQRYGHSGELEQHDPLFSYNTALLHVIISGPRPNDVAQRGSPWTASRLPPSAFHV